MISAGATVDSEAHGAGGTPLIAALFWGTAPDCRAGASAAGIALRQSEREKAAPRAGGRTGRYAIESPFLSPSQRRNRWQSGSASAPIAIGRNGLETVRSRWPGPVWIRPDPSPRGN
jgi:hypothetical protein